MTDPFGALADAPVHGEPEPVRPPSETVAGSSRDRMVSAEVDARGALVNLRVRPEVLSGAHPQRIGRAIVEAMADARAAASRAARARLTAGPT